MERIKKFLKIATLVGAVGILGSCGAGVDYNHKTATLTFIPGEIAFGDLKPNVTAAELETKAKDYEAKGKGYRALKTYQKIAEQFPYTTNAPNARYRMAQYYEAAGKRTKAFDNYQALISTYMGTPLYQSALEKQAKIAHDAALGHYKQRLLVFKTRLPVSTVDTMLKQHIANAPHSPIAAKSQYMRGQLWEQEGNLERAIEQYKEVTRSYPESNFSGEALFRIGSIRYNQSLKGNTNLDNSKIALETFDELKTLYPRHPKVAEAKLLSGQIRGYDVRRSLEIAQFYEKKKQFPSAVFYYNDIITSTPASSEIHKQAKARVAAIRSLNSGN